IVRSSEGSSTSNSRSVPCVSGGAASVSNARHATTSTIARAKTPAAGCDSVRATGFGALASPLEAREVQRRIGRRSVPLRVPDHLSKALEDRVQRRMLVAPREAQALELGADSRWLIDPELFRDREMQREMQERTRLAAFRAEVAVDVPLRVLDEAVV